MKFRHEFRIRASRDEVWRFFEQPLEVARCIPGVEEAEPLAGEDDSYSVRATQKLGPMSTTFQAKVRISERTAGARIAFTATGKAVRGAVGNFRAQNAVTLTQAGGETCVSVEGEVALAGVLGTVGSAVISKHAAKVTAEFASNLERALSAADEPRAEPQPEEAVVERR